MGCHQPTKGRTAEGKTKIMRCLKRYIAREIFSHLLATTPPVQRAAGSCTGPEAMSAW